MNNFRLARGMKIQWNNIEYQIEERLINGQLRLLNKHSNERRLVDEQLLIEEFFKEKLKILGENGEFTNLEKHITKSHVTDFTALDADDPRKIKAQKRYEYLRALFSKKQSDFSNKEIQETIDEVSKRINDPSPPSVRNVRRWMKRIVEMMQDIRALVDSDKSKGNRSRKFSSDPAINNAVLKIINDCINEIYLTLQRNTMRATHDVIEYRINLTNEHRSEDNKLPVPSYKSVCRIISQLDKYEVDKARKGERYANEKHKTLQKGPEPTRPLERVECDDTKTDLMVIDPATSLALGRPWLMLLVDVHTRMILGYHLSFYHPSHVTVMMAMKHAIRPKTYVKEKYPDIINSWDTYGLIEVLVVDNAKHWYGKGIEDACYQMGTDIQFAPVRIPWYKGAVERLLQTIHSGLIHKQPGTTFSNIFDKGDYDPEKHAVIWLDLLEEILHKWIIDIYSQDIHSGINDIPARRWKSSIVKHPPALPPAHTDLDVILGKVTYRKISGTVIHFKNLEYSSSDLAAVKSNSVKNGDVKIKYDPTDLGTIYVHDAFHNRFITVPAVNQEYAAGLTEWQHEVICKFIRKRNQAHINRKALIEAKEYIRQKIATEFNRRPKKLREVGKINKWMAFEDSTKAKIIYHSKNNEDSRTEQDSTKLLSNGNKFIPPAEESDTPLEWSEGEKWQTYYAGFNEEKRDEQ